LGVEVNKDVDGNYEICQRSYINRIIVDSGLQDAKISSVPLDPNYGKYKEQPEQMIDNKKYQQLIGSLLYISVNSRPDITASVSILSQKICKPTLEDWRELKRIVRYLKGTSDFKLKMSNLKKKQNLICGWADANWAEERNDRKSNSGFVFQIYGGVVSWMCRKQACVALSSTEAEFIALSEACQEAVWIRRLVIDLKEDCKVPTIIFEDNQSCLKLIEEEKLSKRSKHIDTKAYFVKDYIDKKIVHCEYCPTEKMLTDLLTKPLPASKLRTLRNLCGIGTNEEEC
jgi:hypothetical protein